MSETNPTNGVAAILRRAADSIRNDYQAGGPNALLRNRAAQIVAGGALLLVFLASRGGTPSDPTVKGIRLGMPVEDAARVLLDHGLPPGGPVEWDESYSGRLVRQEHEDAWKAHYRKLLAEKAAADGVKTPLEYVRKHLSREHLDRLGDFGLSSLAGLTFDDPKPVLAAFKDYGLENPVAESERFPPLDAYIATKYPKGAPYALGGPWDGDAPLKFAENADGTRSLLRHHTTAAWTLVADADGKVTHVILFPSAVDTLFNVEGVGAEEFAASFASSSGVPLEPYVKDVLPEIATVTGEFFRTGWAYLDRGNGWTVTIGEDKRLDLLRITKTSEQSSK